MAYGSARLFAAALRSLGVDAALTPQSNARTRELGAQFTSGDECYPAKVTVGDFMRVLEQPDAEPARTVFFMPTADGPCRFGQYAAYMRGLLDAHGYRKVEVLSPTNTREEIEEKIAAYLAAGATEVWVVAEDGRTRYYDASGERVTSRFGITPILPVPGGS